MLDTDGQAHHAFAHTGLDQLGSVQLAVSGGGRVGRQRLGVANVHQAREQLQRIEEACAGFAASVALEAERQNARSPATRLLLHDGMVGVVLRPA